MTVYVEIPDPAKGAAYQVLFERFLPGNCFSRERQHEILTAFTAIEQWANTQTDNVQKAYVWATQKLRDQIERQVGAHELGNQVIAMMPTFPIPPA